MLPTRERLLLSAIRLIWRSGFNAVSVDAICADAAANKGSFYHAYPSKAAILVKAIERIWEHDRAELEAIAAAPTSAASRFERHIAWFYANQVALRREHGFVPGHFHMSIDLEVPEAAAAAGRSRLEYAVLLRAAVRDMLAEAGAAEQRAQFLAHSIERMIAGVMIEARLSNSLEPVADLVPLVNQLRSFVVSAP